MRELVIVRHGETEWSRSGQHTGRSDLPLLEEGQAQARALGARLAGRRFALVLSSPLRRALDTARLAGFGEDVRTTPDAMEWNYGAYEGRTRAEILAGRPGWTIWTAGVEGGETIEDVSARADRVLAQAEAAEGDVLLFSHGHFLRVLALRWIGLDPRLGARFALGPARIGVLGREGDLKVLAAWNAPEP